MAAQTLSFTKISELSESNTISDNDVIPANVNGETKKVKCKAIFPRTTTQNISGAYGVNDSFQLSTEVLNHSFIILTFGRYGYGSTFVLDTSAISLNMYGNGVGAYINSSRSITIKVSPTGLVTIVSSNDAVNVIIKSIL